MYVYKDLQKRETLRSISRYLNRVHRGGEGKRGGGCGRARQQKQSGGQGGGVYLSVVRAIDGLISQARANTIYLVLHVLNSERRRFLGEAMEVKGRRLVVSAAAVAAARAVIVVLEQLLHMSEDLGGDRLADSATVYVISFH